MDQLKRTFKYYRGEGEKELMPCMRLPSTGVRLPKVIDVREQGKERLIWLGSFEHPPLVEATRQWEKVRLICLGSYSQARPALPCVVSPPALPPFWLVSTPKPYVFSNSKLVTVMKPGG